MQHENPFVCLDEVTDCCEDLNPVIYNPNIDPPETRKNRLYKNMYERYHVKLSDKDLDELVKYNSYQLGEFIATLKRVISKLKEK